MLERDDIVKKIYTLFNEIGVDVQHDGNAGRIDEVMDSLQFISLICDLEETFGISFEDDEIVAEKYNDISDFVELILKKILTL